MEHEGVRHNGAWIACFAGFWIFLALVVFGAGHMATTGPLGWIVLAGLVYFGWRWWGGNNIRKGYYGSRDRAYRVLRQRFANGEIDQEEYEARKGVLAE